MNEEGERGRRRKEWVKEEGERGRRKGWVKEEGRRRKGWGEGGRGEGEKEGVG